MIAVGKLQNNNHWILCKINITGTSPARRDDIVFDGEYIFDSDQLLYGGITILSNIK